MPASLPSFTTGTRRMLRASISLAMSSAVASSPTVASSAVITSRAVLPWALENRSASLPESLNRLKNHCTGPGFSSASRRIRSPSVTRPTGAPAASTTGTAEMPREASSAATAPAPSATLGPGARHDRAPKFLRPSSARRGPAEFGAPPPRAVGLPSCRFACPRAGRDATGLMPRTKPRALARASRTLSCQVAVRRSNDTPPDPRALARGRVARGRAGASAPSRRSRARRRHVLR